MRRRFFSRELFIFGLILTAGISCKSRSFNSQGLASQTKSSTHASDLYEEPKVDPDLLKDDVAPTGTPEADYLANAQIFLGSSYVFNSMLNPDGTVSEWNSQSWKSFEPPVIPEYEKLLKASKLKTVVPKRFAAASVLEILRRNRQEFALNTEGSVVRTEAPALGILSRNPDKVPYTETKDSLYYLFDSTRPFTKTMCGSIPMLYMNPIKWHYMCSTPATFRSCTRFNVGRYQQKAYFNLAAQSTATNSQRLKVFNDVASHDLSYAIEACLDVKGFEAKHPDLKGVYDVESNWPEEFQRFYQSQIVNGVNMFDYIMRSPVYAFDFAQQQAVLNAYYGYMKPKADGAFDPSNQADCEKYREASREEKTGGNYCLAETARDGLYYSNGR